MASLSIRTSISGKRGSKKDSLSSIFNSLRSSTKRSTESKSKSGSKEYNQRRLTLLFNEHEANSRRSNSISTSDSSQPSTSQNDSVSSSDTASSESWDRDRVTGEVKDHTNMLHLLAHDQDVHGIDTNFISIPSGPLTPVATFVSRLDPQIWLQIVSYLDPADEASFRLSAKAFWPFTDDKVFDDLKEPSNFRSRCDLLHRLDSQLPDYLLCYACGKFHVRINPGKEKLRPTNIANPLFNCPHASTTNPALKISRQRITFGRTLPLPFVQLAMRHHTHGSKHGISHHELEKRYKDKDDVGKWSHQTRYAIIDEHLYIRVISTCFAEAGLPLAGMRHLLYSREDFVPFFSVCAHWRDGTLMPSCRCALGHLPVPIEGGGLKRVIQDVEAKWTKSEQLQIVSLCENCRLLRRCPECPTEYLVEIKLQEDRREKDPTKIFKQAMVVTRWSDLGDGSSPWTREWAAIRGDLDALPKQERYDSFKVLGGRAISGVFESFFTVEQVPTARLVNLNPSGERLGEKGHNWY